jgi:integrase/recombinase XerD
LADASRHRLARREGRDAARRIAGPMACPKGLRHAFGIRAAGHSIPTNLIQRWMGHASLTTTAIYLDAVGLEERQFASRMW